jgi:uncharacterized protein
MRMEIEQDGIQSLNAQEWNALPGADNPFLSYEFLSGLESSQSVGSGTGWQAAPLVARQGGKLIAALPAYLKSHSQGEYVFDYAWAEAYQRAGGIYYPKLQIAVPFTSATGPRILAAEEDMALALLHTAQELVEANGFSSAHATFIAPEQRAWFENAGWLIREGVQFHWRNAGYADFASFLATLSSAKRKNLRKERQSAQGQVDAIVHLQGSEIKPEHWEAFWAFYQDTGARKWGQPYLTRAFFTHLGETCADTLLMILAMKNGQPIAGALNFIGHNTLYGRYWGCVEDVPFLHFELCYYQAIDWAIAHGFARVEAGAQGEHKLARGYAPTPVYSAHYIAHEGFRAAIADFLVRERAAMQGEREFLSGFLPFKKI